MKKSLLAFLLILFTFQLQAADYYWVGGGGNWSDINHWRLGSSSGSTASIVPSSGDNVFFGPHAGFGTTAASRTVTINANAFCNHMTWTSDVPNNPVFTRGASTAILLSISGNFTFAPTVTFTGVYVEFVGANPATLTTNGPISGGLYLTINKPGTSFTLADNLVYNSTTNSYNAIVLAAGSLNAAGKTIDLYRFTSNNSNVRTVDITNTKIKLYWGWDYRGANKTLLATGSSIVSGVELHVDAGFYPEVAVGGGQIAYFDISSTTFNKLTFTYATSNSLARIANNNVIDSLVFKGMGTIRYNNNKIKYVSFEGAAIIGGSSNVFQYARIGGSLDLIDQGNHQFDTLITAPNKNINIAGSNTINKYFKAGGLPCDGFTEISGTSAGKLIFAAGAVADIDNVLLSNLSAQGPNTPIAVNGIDNDGNSGFIITEPVGAGVTLYWVNGAGDWNDKTHWSTSSGGPGGACIPFVNDNVVFDANSGFSNGNKVTTSANSYCKDMTWAAGISKTVTFNESSGSALFVYGSIVLNPNVTMNAVFDLKGDAAVTLRTNGSSLGTSQYNVRKSGPASSVGLTLLDDWNNTSSTFALVSGTLDISNRTVNLSTVFTSGSSNKFLNMNKAKVTVNSWSYDGGTNSFLDATDSYLLVKNSIVTRTNTYNIVDCSATAGDKMDIAATRIGQLTFTDTGLMSAARIHRDNIIRRLEFKGRGMIRYGGNDIDSLITAENRNLYFYETANGTKINKYFKATHPSCSGLGEIRSGTSAISTLIFAANTKVDISNVYLENIAATGGGGSLQLPIPFSGADAGGNSGWTISSSIGNARYWIGGAGDWNDASHWSLSSGGAGGACIPTVGNDVYFDVKSGFTSASRTITVSNGNAYFHNMSWAGALNDPILSKSSSWIMECWGNSIVLNPLSTLSIAPLLLKGSEATIMSGQCKGNFDLQIDKPGGSLTLANDYDNGQTDFSLVQGDFIAPGHLLNISSIDNGGRDNNISLDISGSTINVNTLRYSGGTTKRTLNAANSIINGNLTADGFNYNIVNAPGVGSTNVSIANTNIKELNFTNPSSTSAIGIYGANNTIGRVEYKGSGGIYGTNNTIGTLIFFPGDIYILNGGTNTTITGDWFGSGTPCRPTEIKTNNTATASITKTSGSVDFDYVRLQRMVAKGGAKFKAREHSTDLGGNTGWVISPYDGAAPILGLGPDLELKNNDLPYTIKTDGFFGSPLSRYEWKKDGTIISNSSELKATKAGTYSVKVDFPDGCSITDDITITLVSADLSIIKTVDNNKPAAGANVVFKLLAHNDGPGLGTGVAVSDQLPAGYTYISNTASAGTTYNMLTGLWTIGDLAADADAILSITAKVNPDGPYQNTAIISGNSDDPKADNNSSSVTLVPSPSLTVKQPDCSLKTGSIDIPLISGGTYSIDGGISFGGNKLFSNLVPGDYAVLVKVGDDISAPILVTINEAPLAPDAPLSGGNQVFCATNPLQVLMATAKVPAGTTITWYDAAIGGNVVAAPVLNAVGSITYYAEASANGCSSVNRTPVKLTINQSPFIDAIADQTVCGTFALPAITGVNLSGKQAYYTEINKGGIKYNSGDVFSTTGETTLYAYDEIVPGGDSNPEAALTLAYDATYSTAKLSMLFPDQSRGIGRVLGVNNIGNPAASTNFANFITGASASAQYSVMVGKLTLPAGYVKASDQVLISLENAYMRSPAVLSPAMPGYAGQLAIINTATNQLLYQTSFGDIPSITGGGAKPVVSGVVSVADLVAGNIGVFAEFKLSLWRISGLTAKYQFVSNVAGCPAQQSFKITVNPIPDAPVSGGNQIACETSANLTLTARATVVTGSTVVWYNAPTGGNIVSAPILNAPGTVTYYAESHNGVCISASRTPVTLTINAQPVLSIHHPAVLCHPATVNLTATAVTSGSTPGLQFTYFTDAIATNVLTNPAAVALSGTYYIKGTNPLTGCSTIAPVSVQFVDRPELRITHPDCVSTSGNISITSPLGNGFEYSIDDGLNYQASIAFPDLSAGIYKVKARNKAIPACVSDVNTVVINATPTTAIPIVVQPDCDQTTGKITFPVDPLYEYSINGNAFSATNEFTGLTPGSYVLRSKKAGDVCVADPVTVVIVANTGRPAAPVGTDQLVCASGAGQTLTAQATGSNVVWYDAPVGGNLISSPSLSNPGTIVYYAESSNGTCSGQNRTAVRLTITALPVINAIADKNACGSLILPVITGVNLSGNQAYYTQANGGGKKYSPGDLFNTTGLNTLYAYDKSTSGSCSSNQSFQILIQNTTAGGIAQDQTICMGSKPQALTSVTAGTGFGSISYRWEQSVVGATTGFTAIAGVQTAGYAAGSLTVTTWFRRITISSYNGVQCESVQLPW